MTDDERALRGHIDTFTRASETGDYAAARALVADDAVFLVPGHGAMTADDYVAGATATSDTIDFELESTIDEVTVVGDVAWSQLRSKLDIIPRNGDPTTRMAGTSLVVWQRRDGAWRIVRSADTLVVVPT